MLGGVGVGAGDEHAPLRVLGEGRPDLLPGDHPFVAVLDRRRLQRGEVGARLGLGEPLAPDLLAGEDRLQVALLLLLGAVGDHHRPAHRQAEHVGRARRFQARRLADEDRLLDQGRAAAAVLLRPGDPGPAGLVHLALPLAPEGHHLLEARLRLGAGVVLLEPGANLVAELLLGRREASGPSVAEHTWPTGQARPVSAAPPAASFGRRWIRSETASLLGSLGPVPPCASPSSRRRARVEAVAVGMTLADLSIPGSVELQSPQLTTVDSISSLARSGASPSSRSTVVDLQAIASRTSWRCSSESGEHSRHRSALRLRRR